VNIIESFMKTLPIASTFAEDVDALYSFIYWISLVSFLIIVVGMVYLVWKYHRSKVPEGKTSYITGYTPLEAGVSVILLVLVMVIFYWGWVDYKKMLIAPRDAMEINIMGRQWLWEVEYNNGRKLVNEIVIPKGKPVKLIMGSADVLHSFYVPAFRAKQDLVPGAYTSLWFNATEEGEYDVFCAEYCGTAHSQMLAKIKVVKAKEYTRWQRQWELNQQLGIQSEGASKPMSLVERGEKLITSKGCVACHTVNGNTLIGPTFKGSYGHEVELADGTKVKMDENYLRSSIMDPTAQLVKGYQPVMPTFRGTLTDDEVNAIVAYIKSLGKE
jgi:cytochrome c oxidase subunit II